MSRTHYDYQDMLTRMLALLLPALLAAQSAVLQIRLVQAEGTVHAAGVRAPGLTVEITDELGKPVAAAIVSVQLPDDGPGGSFASGLNSDIVTTGADGRATTSPVRWIRITASTGTLRAGAMVLQHLAAEVPAAKRAPPPAAPAPAARKKSHRRWLIVGVLAAGAAGAGFASGWASRSSTPSPASAPGPAPIQIGAPTITVGRP